MRRITTVLAALGAVVLLVLTGCSTPPATTAESAQPASIGYARLPDGRVLTCIKSTTRGPRDVYTCDWGRPFSTDGTVPAGADYVVIDSFTYVKLSNGNRLQCISWMTSGPYWVTDCDWDHPIEPR